MQFQSTCKRCNQVVVAPIGMGSRNVFKDWEQALEEHIESCPVDKLTVGELREAIKDLPDNAEVLIPTKGSLWTASHYEISFFTRKENKHLKIICKHLEKSEIKE